MPSTVLSTPRTHRLNSFGVTFLFIMVTFTMVREMSRAQASKLCLQARSDLSLGFLRAGFIETPSCPFVCGSSGCFCAITVEWSDCRTPYGPPGRRYSLPGQPFVYSLSFQVQEEIEVNNHSAVIFQPSH